MNQCFSCNFWDTLDGHMGACRRLPDLLETNAEAAEQIMTPVDFGCNEYVQEKDKKPVHFEAFNLAE